MKSMRLVTCALFAFALLLAVPAWGQSSQQIVFSAQNPPSTGAFMVAGSTTSTPFGFWIWCEGASTNPYTGECSGAMYFYHLGITTSVKDTAAPVISGGTITLFVGAADSSFACTLSAPSPPSAGPSNTITVTCSGVPSGIGFANKAVVQVTD